MMTPKRFWECLDQFYNEGDMKEFFKLWNSYPKYVKEYFDKFDKEMSAPNSDLHKQEKIWWEKVKARMTEEFGEEWVNEHYSESASSY